MVKYEMGMGGMDRDDPPCPRCHSSENVRMKGKWKFDLGDGTVQIVQRYHCSKCNFHFHPEKRIPKKRKHTTHEVLHE